MNKKGIFMPMMVILTLILFSWAYYYLVFGESTNYRQVIGKNQEEIYNIYADGEKIKLYVDESAKQAAYSSVLELAKNGGYKDGEINECGQVAGYNIWHVNGRECYPRYTEEKFLEIFKMDFDKYLSNYDGLKDVYELSVNDDGSMKVKGKSNEDYILGNSKIKSSLNPSFEEAIPYSLADYNELKLIMTDAVKLCKTADCFYKFVDTKKYDWKIIDRDDYVLFDANSKKRVFNQDVVIKFAVYKNA